MSDSVLDLIDQAAAKYGEDPATARAIASIEDPGLNPNAANPYSSAKGVFQFTAGTWAQYGHGGNVYDPAANIDAGIRLLHDNRIALQGALGRAPTAGELYLGHQQGAGGAIKLLSNPGAAAESLVGLPAVLQNGGYRGMSAADFAGHWNAKMASAMARAGGPQMAAADLSTTGDRPGAGLPTFDNSNTGLGSPQAMPFGDDQGNNVEALDPNNMSVPSAQTHDYSEVDQGTGIHLDPQQASGDFFQGVRDSLRYGLTSQLLRSVSDYDPNALPYQMSKEEFDRRMQGLDPSYAAWFSRAVTPQIADKIEAEAREHQAAMENLGRLGWGGAAASLLGNAMDPASLAVGLATGGLGDLALAGRAGLAASRVARVAAQAGAGAASATALTAGLNAVGPPDAQGQSLGHAALTGALFGAGYGLLGHNPTTAEEAAGIVGGARKGLNELTGFDRSGAGDGGAAVSRGYDYGGGSDELTSLTDKDVATTAFGKARWSIAGVIGRSKSPAARALGSAIFDDSVGKSDYSLNPQSAALELTWRDRAYQGEIARFRKPAFDEWAQDNNYSPAEASNRASEFEELVHDYITAGTPTEKAAFPAYVKKYGDAIASQEASILKEANNPLMREGMQGEPIEGFGAITEDARYLKRMWSPENVGQFVDKHGMLTAQRLIGKGMKSAMPGLDDEVIDRIAPKFMQSIYDRGVGVMDDRVARMFAADDLDAHQKAMEQIGIDPADALALRKELEKDRGDAGKDTNAKRRLVLDIDQEINGVKIRDLLVKDATFLAQRYARDMAGKIALARQRIVNPNTGKVLVNGITGDRAWERALRQTREDMANRGMTKDQIRAETDALNFGRDRVLGIPHEKQNTNLAKALRLIGKFNMMRLGASFVFPHSGQIGNMMSSIGVRSLMDNLPAWRRIITADGEWVKANDHARHVEAIWGAGQEKLMRGMESSRWDHDLGNVPYMGRNHWMDKVDHGLTKAQHVVSDWSGMTAMDGLMRQWTVHGIVGQFAHMAKTMKQDANGRFDTRSIGTMSSANWKRMQHLGLDDDMLNRVLSQAKQHMDTTTGMFGTTKVTKMNLDKWDDKEAQIKFVNAVQRYASKTIQDNDIGSMSNWMGSPLARAFMQLRNFPLAAWDKRLLHNIHMRDGNAMAYLVADTLTGLTLWSAQRALQGIGNSDPDYWNKAFDPSRVIQAGVQRSSWGSIIPMVAATAAKPFGLNLFDERSTSQPGDAIFGNPYVSMFNDASNALGAVGNPIIHHRAMSQDEAHQLQRIFTNHMAVTSVLNLMTRSLPAHPPWAETHPHN